MIRKKKYIGATGDYAKYELACIKALAKLLKQPYKKTLETVNLDNSLLKIISVNFDKKISIKETAKELKNALIKVAKKSPLESFVEILKKLPKKETETIKPKFPMKLPATVTIGKVKKPTRRMSGTHTDNKSHNVKINVLSGINEKLNFNEKVGVIYAHMKIVQDKIINREKLTPYEEKLFQYISMYGFHYGSKKAVRDKLI